MPVFLKPVRVAPFLLSYLEFGFIRGYFLSTLRAQARTIFIEKSTIEGNSSLLSR